jgi:hypothetical protein
MGEQPVERLREYLGRLTPAAQAMLATALERGVLRGDEVAAGELVLKELRRVAWRPAQLFFRPLEPFLVDDATKRPGRIRRAALEPIWTWIGRDLLPDGTRTFSQEMGRALVASADADADRLTTAFQTRVADEIARTLAMVQGNERASGRLAGQIGTPNAIEDVADLRDILRAREQLAALGERLSGHCENFIGGHVDAVKAVLDSHVLQAGDNALRYALVLLACRLESPWQIIRVAVRAARSDDAARVAATPYGVAVAIVLADLDWMVRQLRAVLERGRPVDVVLLKRIHDSVRGLRTELSFPVDSAWMRGLAGSCAETARVLETQIGSAPARVRRLLRLRPVHEIPAGTALDENDVAETEALVELVNACRHLASDLAISEVTTRSCQELEQYLDMGTRPLLEALRTASAADRPFRHSQVQAAVRFCAKMFGQEYAALLAKAAAVAAQQERKAAAQG